MNEKETNLENQLRSWRPRRPSAKLKRRIFGITAANDTAALTIRWLAPAAACLLLAVTIIHQEPGLTATTSAPEPVMEMVSSNVSYTNLVPRSDNPERNRVLPASFEWTNLSGSSSSISPFSPVRMN